METEKLYLVDTSAWIWALRKGGVEKVRSRIDELLALDRVATIPMIELELLGGAGTEREFAILQDRLDGLHRLALDDECWQKAARLAFDLRRKGLTIPFTDIVVAAVALVNGAVVLHADEDFDLIALHVPLLVESLVEGVRLAEQQG